MIENVFMFPHGKHGKCYDLETEKYWSMPFVVLNKSCNPYGQFTNKNQLNSINFMACTDDNINIQLWNSINRPWPGGRLNKKDGLTRYGDSHVKDKTS